MNKYPNADQVDDSAESKTFKASDITPGRQRRRKSTRHRQSGPISKEELYIRLVAGSLSAFEEPERRYCPNDLELADYLEETLNSAQQKRIRLHIGTCPACRELLDEISITTSPDAEAAVHQIQRRRRLHQLIDIARKCLGGNKEKLATQLDCEPADIYPDTDQPGVEFICRLAQILGWSVDTVRELIDTPELDTTGRAKDAEFDALESAMKLNYYSRQHEKALKLSKQANKIAGNSEQRAQCCLYEGNQYRELGQYDYALEAFRRGLHESLISDSMRQILTVNLANALYARGDIYEACALADTVIQWFKDNPHNGRRDTGSWGFAYYVRGSALLRLMEHDPDNARGHARQVRHDLRFAHKIFSNLHKLGQDSNTWGIAHTCLGGLIVAEIALCRRDARYEVEALLKMVNSVDDPANWPQNDWLESLGWSCVYGAQIALRYLSYHLRERNFTIFIERGLMIANRLEHWSIRERLLTFWYEFYHTHSVDCHDSREYDHIINQVESHIVAGIMERIPVFRQIGMEILGLARITGRLR